MVVRTNWTAVAVKVVRNSSANPLISSKDGSLPDTRSFTNCFGRSTSAAKRLASYSSASWRSDQSAACSLSTVSICLVFGCRKKCPSSCPTTNRFCRSYGSELRTVITAESPRRTKQPSIPRNAAYRTSAPLKIAIRSMSISDGS